MAIFILGTVNKTDRTIGINANGVEVERVALSQAASRIKELRAQAATAQRASYQTVRCYTKRVRY